MYLYLNCFPDLRLCSSDAKRTWFCKIYQDKLSITFYTLFTTKTLKPNHIVSMVFFISANVIWRNTNSFWSKYGTDKFCESMNVLMNEEAFTKKIFNNKYFVTYITMFGRHCQPILISDVYYLVYLATWKDEN